MESQFLSLGMDIIGLGVFNYDFRSLTTESPVIKVRTFYVNLPVFAITRKFSCMGCRYPVLLIRTCTFLNLLFCLYCTCMLDKA